MMPLHRTWGYRAGGGTGEQRATVLCVGDAIDADRLRDMVAERASGPVNETWSVREVASLSDAEQALSQDPVEAIVSSHDLPDGTGLDLVQRSQTGTHGPRFVLFPQEGSERLASRVASVPKADYVSPTTSPAPYRQLAEILCETPRSVSREESLPGRAQVDPIVDFLRHHTPETVSGVMFEISAPSRTLDWTPISEPPGDSLFEMLSGEHVSDLYDLIAPSDRERVKTAFESCFRDESQTDIDAALHLPDGSLVYVHFCLRYDERPCTDTGRVVGTCFDRTPQKERELFLSKVHDHEKALTKAEQTAGLRQSLITIREHLDAAESYEDVATLCCEALAESEWFKTGWVGRVDRAANAIQPVATTAQADEFIDDLPLSLDESVSTPAVRVVRSGSPVARWNISPGPDGPDWRDHAVAHGVSNVVAVPLSYDGVRYGVLSVVPESDLTVREEAVDSLSSLGKAVGHVYHTVAMRETLMADDRVVVEFESDADGELLAQLAAALGTRLIVSSVIVRGDGEYLIHLEVPHDMTDELVATATDADVVHSTSRLASSPSSVSPSHSPHTVDTTTDRETVELVTSMESILADVYAEGADLRWAEFSATGLTARAVVSKSQAQPFIDRLSTSTPDGDVVARRTTQDPSTGTLDQSVLDSLTERQQDVLQAAYLSGYFESPREIDGGTLAERLGISQPNFSEHRRAALKTVLASLFDR